MKQKQKFQITHVHLFTLSGVFALMSVLLVACKSPKEGDRTMPEQILGGHSSGHVRIVPENYVTAEQGFYNFGDPNFAKIAKKFNQLKNRKAEKGTVLSVMQFGDSHTASDTITAHLRQRFQQDLGDAGIGWITPMNASGQRHSLVSFNSQGWTLTSSRTTKEANFPLGGFIATPSKSGASITVSSKENSQAVWEARFILKGTEALTLTDTTGQVTNLNGASQYTWTEQTAEVTFPFTIQANSVNSTQLGGIWLRKKNSSGAEISPVGANGVQQIVWNRWSPQWEDQLKNSHVDLVILSYGTNEAFNDKLDVANMKNSLRTTIRTIKQALPNSSIVIVGAPDSMRKKVSSSLECNQRQPYMLKAVKQAQLEVAKEEKTLYWDWQKAMGGDCSMLIWNRMQLTANDLVHFSNLGYKRSAEMFYEDFTNLVEKK